MAKKLKIEACIDCKYCKMISQYYLDSGYLCKNTVNNIELENPKESIPDWCKLEEWE
jgi:hypothetical protein